MNIILLEDSKKIRRQITEALEKKRCNLIVCAGSGHFMEALEQNNSDLIVINAETWVLGKSIYSYFNIAKKLEKAPIIFYNSTEKFLSTEMNSRQKHVKDQILSKPTNVETLLEAIQRAM